MVPDLLECKARPRSAPTLAWSLTHPLDYGKEGLEVNSTRETWKPIPGYPGYEASDLGSIRSVDRSVVNKNGVAKALRGRVLAQTVGDKSYRLVSIGGHTRRVHRLVLMAHVGVEPDLQVRHLDGNPANNKLENLRYGTGVENSQDCLNHGTHPQASKTHCRNGHPYSGTNVRYSSTGERVCRTCRREQARKRRELHPQSRAEKDAINNARRLPCKGCGGPKEPGKRWRYCLACRPRVSKSGRGES